MRTRDFTEVVISSFPALIISDTQLLPNPLNLGAAVDAVTDSEWKLTLLLPILRREMFPPPEISGMYVCPPSFFVQN